MNDHDTERELHEAVHSYGERVQPEDRLGQIRRAVAASRRQPAWQQPWVLAGGAALAAASLVVGVLTLGGSERTDQSPPPAAPQREVTVYEMRTVGADDTPWLYPESVTVVDTGDPVYDAVLALIGDGSTDTSRWKGCPYGHLESVGVSDTVVTVSLAGRAVICDMDPRIAESQEQQLAWTVRAAAGSTLPVAVERDGRAWFGRPITADPAALSPVLIGAPAEGETVTSPVTMSGTNDTYEGNVPWQVLDGDDVVAEGATIGGTLGDRRPWRDTVRLEPGRYTLRVWESSAEDGSLVAEDTTTFTVS